MAVDSEAFWKASSIPYKDCPQDIVDFVRPDWLDEIDPNHDYCKSCSQLHIHNNRGYKDSFNSKRYSCSGVIGKEQ